ncbi:hypothetical protein QQP08_000207 [Theobroma cacao]|nr:hypothetical protein QQP08_000207 [Theobroma cacao]
MHRKHFFDRPKSKTSIYDDLSSASLPSLMMKDGQTNQQPDSSKYDGASSLGDHPWDSIEASYSIFGAIKVGLSSLEKLNTRSASC